jgi:hypothetical protein
MARYLKQNTATRVTVGPFLDKTDGITPEVALTATNEKLTFVVDDGGVPTLVIDANATASGGNNDFVHITGDDAGYYDLELTAAQTNYVGRAVLSINYATDHLPVFHEFTILPANVYDSWMGTDKLDVNVAEWLGTAAATPTTNGVPEVDVTYLNGSTTELLKFLASASTIVRGTVDNSAFTLTSTEFESDDVTTATADFYNGRLVLFTSGTLQNQAARINDYAKVGSNGHFTVSAMTGAPGNNDTFVIV